MQYLYFFFYVYTCDWEFGEWAVEMEMEVEMEEAVLPLKSGAIKISLSANKQISSSTSQR